MTNEYLTWGIWVGVALVLGLWMLRRKPRNRLNRTRAGFMFYVQTALLIAGSTAAAVIIIYAFAPLITR